MEKISSILPSTARIRTVDLNDGQAARPGGPSFGRPVGVSTLSDQNPETTAMKAHKEFKSLMETRKDPRSAIVSQVSAGFFMKQPIEERMVADLPGVDSEYVDYSVPDEYQVMADQNVLGTKKPEAEPQVVAPAAQMTGVELETEEEMDLPDVGRYLDVNV